MAANRFASDVVMGFLLCGLAWEMGSFGKSGFGAVPGEPAWGGASRSQATGRGLPGEVASLLDARYGTADGEGGGGESVFGGSAVRWRDGRRAGFRMRSV